MKNIFVWILLLGCVGYIAGDAYKEYKPFVAQPRPEQRVLELPEDGQAYYTSLFLPANWKADATSRSIYSWFETNEQLRGLRAQTHWNVYDENDLFYRTRYFKIAPVLPAVVIQDSTGRVVASVTTFSTPEGLVNDLQYGIETGCIRRWRERREPVPAPAPVPAPQPTPGPINGPPAILGGSQWQPPYLLAAIGLAVGLGIGAGTKWYETYYKTE
jgi:hypothetical protein